MKLDLDFTKSVDQNAADYYNKAKKVRNKLEGIDIAIKNTMKLIKKEIANESPLPSKKIQRKKEWYESFHWMFVDGHLVVGGKDARSNDLLVKKHFEKGDLFFHSELPGASVVIAQKGEELNDEQLESVAMFAGCFSSLWKEGRGTADVYCVRSDQVKTAAKSGEYLSKGSFVIQGERKYFRNLVLQLGITLDEGKLLIMPPDMIKGKKIVLKPDAKKTKGESAKLSLKKLKELFPDGAFDINWVQEILPNGGSRVY